MRRTFFLFRSSFPLLLPDDPTRPPIKQHPDTSDHQAATDHDHTPPHQREARRTASRSHLTTSTDRHASTASGRAMGAPSPRLDGFTP